jgi:uncharacterized protein YndB with AHSA1/START domain
MTKSLTFKPNPKLDLVLERTLDVPRELVWTAWTTPKHIREWFVPKPWTITDCEIDLRPGGVFRSVMRSPEGQEFPNIGCYLEIVPNERLIWTDALLPGYRPAENPFFTAILSLESQGSGTLLYGDRAASRRRRAQEARRDGIPGRLGHRRQPDGRLYQGQHAVTPKD